MLIVKRDVDTFFERGGSRFPAQATARKGTTLGAPASIAAWNKSGSVAKERKAHRLAERNLTQHEK